MANPYALSLGLLNNMMYVLTLSCH
uniref:Uncharacterized protein n=1 Tax=Rhizophora mucronata TaxID=61149 RepID=A0A2P2R0M5_RHIMU